VRRVERCGRRRVRRRGEREGEWESWEMVGLWRRRLVEGKKESEGREGTNLLWRKRCRSVVAEGRRARKALLGWREDQHVVEKEERERKERKEKKEKQPTHLSPSKIPSTYTSSTSSPSHLPSSSHSASTSPPSTSSTLRRSFFRPLKLGVRWKGMERGDQGWRKSRSRV
jgi:hypothetical protein